MLIEPYCALDAHSSSTICAYNAHDFSVLQMHNWEMDIDWFKRRKRDKRVTDLQIAEAFGVERSVVNKAMNGKVALDAYKADRIATLLETSPEEILYRAGVPIRDPAVSWLPSATVLTSALAALLETVGIDPFEDERAQKLARLFPDALRRSSALHEGLAADLGSYPAESSPDVGEDRRSA